MFILCEWYFAVKTLNEWPLGKLAGCFVVSHEALMVGLRWNKIHCFPWGQRFKQTPCFSCCLNKIILFSNFFTIFPIIVDMVLNAKSDYKQLRCAGCCFSGSCAVVLFPYGVIMFWDILKRSHAVKKELQVMKFTRLIILKFNFLHSVVSIGTIWSEWCLKTRIPFWKIWCSLQ